MNPISGMFGYGYPPIDFDVHIPKPAKLGDRPKDRKCKQCGGEGCCVLAHLDGEAIGVNHWCCKLCGKREKQT